MIKDSIVEVETERCGGLGSAVEGGAYEWHVFYLLKKFSPRHSSFFVFFLSIYPTHAL